MMFISDDVGIVLCRWKPDSANRKGRFCAVRNAIDRRTAGW
jgi:hypothetical protein